MGFDISGMLLTPSQLCVTPLKWCHGWTPTVEHRSAFETV